RRRGPSPVPAADGLPLGRRAPAPCPPQRCPAPRRRTPEGRLPLRPRRRRLGGGGRSGGRPGGPRGILGAGRPDRAPGRPPRAGGGGPGPAEDAARRLGPRPPRRRPHRRLVGCRGVCLTGERALPNLLWVKSNDMHWYPDKEDCWKGGGPLTEAVVPQQQARPWL